MQASSEQDLDNGSGTKLWECCVLYCHQENVIPPDPSLPSGVSVSRYLSFSDVTLLFGNYSLRSARCLAILFSVVACLNISPLCRPTTMNTDEVFRTIRSQTTNRYDILRDFDNVVTTLNTVTTLLITGLSTPAHTPHTQHRLHDRYRANTLSSARISRFYSGRTRDEHCPTSVHCVVAAEIRRSSRHWSIGSAMLWRDGLLLCCRLCWISFFRRMQAGFVVAEVAPVR